MDDGSDEDYFFEIKDHTTVSPLERLVSDIEETLRAWLSTPVMTVQKSSIMAKCIGFQLDKNTCFSLSLKLLISSDSFEWCRDFSEDDNFFNCLASLQTMVPDIPIYYLNLFFGTKKCAILEVASASVPISFSKYRDLLCSALSIAASNAACRYPAFVLEKNSEVSSNCYGIAFGENHEMTRCHVVGIPKLLDRHQLFRMFNEKLASLGVSPVESANEPLFRIARSELYIVKNFPSHYEPTFVKKYVPLAKLPFGVRSGGIKALEIGLISEWRLYSDDFLGSLGDRPHAKYYRLVSVCPSDISGDMWIWLNDFVQSTKNDKFICDIVGSLGLEMSDQSNVASIRNLGYDPRLRDQICLLESNVQEILLFIFPDSVTNEEAQLETNKEVPIFPSCCEYLVVLEDQFKAAPLGSLTYRIAMALMHVAQLSGELGVAYIWREIVLELQFRWDRKILLPDLGSGNPDFSTCRIHQKLQMFNCCIRAFLSQADLPRDDEEQSETEDVFHDCSESFVVTPCGRLHPLPDTFLLNSEERLWIPITQCVPPFTEDMGKSSQHILLLFNDMQAFKAANPSASFADFIQWYSSKDYKLPADENDLRDSEKNFLSERMNAQDNIWRETWERARPIPVSRQEKMFDEDSEVRKILQEFCAYNTYSLVMEFSSMILRVVFCTISDYINDSGYLKFATKSSKENIFTKLKVLVYEDIFSEKLTVNLKDIESVLCREVFAAYNVFQVKEALPANSTLFGKMNELWEGKYSDESHSMELEHFISLSQKNNSPVEQKLISCLVTCNSYSCVPPDDKDAHSHLLHHRLLTASTEKNCYIAGAFTENSLLIN